MRLIVLGDIQLKDNKESIRWDVNHNGLCQFIESLELDHDDVVVQVGDFFDKTMHKGYTNCKALEAVKMMSVANVILLQGNHDYSRYSGSNLELFRGMHNVTIADDVGVTLTPAGNFLTLPYLEGIQVGGKYEQYVNDNLNRLKIDHVDYVIGHHSFKENKIMDSPYLDRDLIQVEYKQMFMGHIHKFSQIGEKEWCTGAICPDTKAEYDYPFCYLEVVNDKVAVKPVEGFFSQFNRIDYSDPTQKCAQDDFAVVYAHCKQEDKYLVEQEIRNRFSGNLYAIEWSFEDEAVDVKVTVASNDALVKKFFEENTYSKDVRDSVFKYYNKVV